jgi:hypothetical protein
MSSAADVELMPRWLDGNYIDPKWIQAVTDIQCVSCSATDISNETRKTDGDAKDGATLRLKLESTEQDEQIIPSLIVKQVTERGMALAQSHKVWGWLGRLFSTVTCATNCPRTCFRKFITVTGISKQGRRLSSWRISIMPLIQVFCLELAIPIIGNGI